jgi:predicted ATP-dependent endonuclease of OLD family
VVPNIFFAKDKKVEIVVRNASWKWSIKWHGQQLENISQILQSFEGKQAPEYNQQLVEARNLLYRTVYLGPYRNIANRADQGQAVYYDLVIGNSFVIQWDSYKSGIAKQGRYSALVTEEEIAELLGFDSLEINASQDKHTLLLTINKSTPLALMDVGSGIAQLILSIVSVATRSPSIILIDEPELHLHPSMQIKFLQVLAKYADYGVIFSTHAVGLARQVADQIYLVNQDRKTGKSSLTPFDAPKSGAQILGEMSYSQFNAMGGSHLLLVEGSSEVRLMHVLLRKLKIEASVMVLPLGGSSLIGTNRESELSEFKRTGASIFVLVDSEKSSFEEPLQSERAAFGNTCRQLFGEEQVHILERRATENYWPTSAIQKVKGENYKALEPFQLLRDAENSWNKSENWRIADASDWKDLQETDLGKFLLKLASSVTESNAQG